MTPLSATLALDTKRCGGKAAALARATAAGLPVPAGVVLSVEEVDAIVAGAHNHRLLEEILEAFPDCALAVRSSAIGEDSEKHSFAGQYTSVLGVRGKDSLRQAILAIERSSHSAAAASYRARHGSVTPPKLAVVIQALLASEIAGVLFTRNPSTGENERVIEAGRGLGDAVVGGEITPDRYRVARGGTLLEHTPGEHPIELSEAQLLALDRLATDCEALFGGNQDLEWAFVGDRLYLLQCRPISRPISRPITGRAGGGQ